jgi:glycosyltransferase involved in cell wall biosynthesis
LQRHLAEDCHFDGNRVQLCYNGVDTTEFYPKATARSPELKSASLVIGTVCVLRPEKAVPVLLAAWARVRDFVPGSKLLIVGDGPELPSLQAYAHELGLADSCVFLPATASVAPIMRSIDIFVLPSRSEAFSNALLEAMACGCCVVGSRVGGTPELIGEKEERGLLFESGNVDDLAAKLARLLADFELRQALSEAAVRFAHDTLRIEANVSRTMQIYDQFLQRKRRTS